MSLPRYAAYKESDLQWLGSFPDHWTVRPFWTLFRRLKRCGFQDEQLLSVYRDYGVIPKASRDDNFNKPSDDLSAYQLVEPGDLAINKMKAWQGSVAISEFRGIVSPAYFVFKAEHNEVPRYLHYLLRSAEYTAGYLSISKGVRPNQWDLEPQEHSRMPVLLPPRQEQAAIATFLDRETAKIDMMVEEQKRLSELLKEKRQAIISHAVTKGLNPDAPMKDTGIEWLGEVPEHWHVVPIKRSIEVRDGTHATPEYIEPFEGSYPLVTSKDFGDTSILFEDAKHISEKDHLEIIRRSNTQRGDVLMSMIGGNIGKAVMVQTDREFSIKNVALFKTNKSDSTAKFLLYYLQSGLLQIQVDLISRGGAQAFLGLGDLRNLTYFLISDTEMKSIVDGLDTMLAPISRLLEEAETCLALMQERRAAVISGAVTGKIDVWNVAEIREAAE